MRKSYLIATAAGLLLALGGAAQAGHVGAPPGFSANSTGHGGFETFSSGTTANGWGSTTKVPEGWDQGNAAWKKTQEDPGSTTFNPPPGLGGTK